MLELSRQSYDLDLIDSHSLIEIEVWIKDVAGKINYAQAAIAIELYWIDKEALYTEAGYSSMTEYVREAPDRLNMPKQTLSNYLAIGEALTKYRRKLTQIKYDLSNGLSKLWLLESALSIHKEAEVWKNIARMTFRQFAEYARPKSIDKPATFDDDPIDLTVKDDGIWFGSRNMVSTKDVEKIIQAGDLPYLIGVYNEGEKRVIQSALKAHREKA